MQLPRDRAWFRQKKVLVFGLGTQGGGEAVVRWLRRAGAIVRVTDQQTPAILRAVQARLQLPASAWVLGQHRAEDIDWADVIIKNNAVPNDAPLMKRAIAKGIMILNDAALYFLFSQSPTIAVTGTRGKTTTTNLLYQCVKAAHGQAMISGNIPHHGLADILDRTAATRPVVAEISSYQLETMRDIPRGPHVAIMTNLHVDHLSRHGTMRRYAQTKYLLFRYLTPNDVAVLNAENTWAQAAAKKTHGQVLWFGHAPKGSWSVYVHEGWIMEKRDGHAARIVRRADLALPGEHQTMNLLAAVAGACAFGVPPAAIAQAVRRFRGVPGRQEVVRRWHDHAFINDTTATSPEGLLVALDVFPNDVFIVGGTDKALDFRAVVKRLRTHRGGIVWLPGNATEKIHTAMKLIDAAPSKSMDEAVRRAVAIAKPGQAIVLSPGAASFGLFRNEFDRGDQFIRVVKKLR